MPNEKDEPEGAKVIDVRERLAEKRLTDMIMAISASNDDGAQEAAADAADLLGITEAQVFGLLLLSIRGGK